VRARTFTHPLLAISAGGSFISSRFIAQTAIKENGRRQIPQGGGKRTGIKFSNHSLWLSGVPIESTAQMMGQEDTKTCNKILPSKDAPSLSGEFDQPYWRQAHTSLSMISLSKFDPGCFMQISNCRH
jgi:hypothetical protein